MTKKDFIREEKSLAKWHLEKVKEARQYFEYADISQNILEQQNDDDLLLLQDWLMVLHNKLKVDDERRNEVLLLIQGIFRIDKYCGGLVTVCKGSNARLHLVNKRIEELESEVRTLNRQIITDKIKFESEKSKLEKEIEFITKNG